MKSCLVLNGPKKNEIFSVDENLHELVLTKTRFPVLTSTEIPPVSDEVYDYYLYFVALPDRQLQLLYPSIGRVAIYSGKNV
jgi:hypothetical protein